MKKEYNHVKRDQKRKTKTNKRRVTFQEDENKCSISSKKQQEDISNSPAIRGSHNSLEVERKLNQKKNRSKTRKTELRSEDGDDGELSQTEMSRKKKLKKKKKMKRKTATVENKDVARIPKESSNKAEKAFLYLERWEYDRDNWKFEKLTQLWLLKNMFEETKVPEKYFQILLKYLIDLKGAIKNFAMDSCDSIIKEKEQKVRETEEDKQFEFAYQRARSILQHLQQ